MTEGCFMSSNTQILSFSRPVYFKGSGTHSLLCLLVFPTGPQLMAIHYLLLKMLLGVYFDVCMIYLKYLNSSKCMRTFRLEQWQVM